jgi:coproporphyrinogen III oxidase-like Fe-S oxidoreductase
MRMISGKGQAIQGEESLTKEQAMTEALFLGLRLINGMAVGKFEELFGTADGL